MNTIQINKINAEELMYISQFFIGTSYQDCDQQLSFVLRNDNNEFCGFAFARSNNIDLNCNFSEKIEITLDMTGCEILQIYATSIELEASLLNRLYKRIFIWGNNGKSAFDYLWSESLSYYDFYSDVLNCNKVIQQSNNEQKEIIYSKLR